ncbi:hypothetical protein V2A60_003438 [Cordyceps javanica]
MVGRRAREYPSPKPPASLFCHINYDQHEQYPNGVSELAGFWAEDQIFGGVVLFDWGESGTEAKSVWLHSGRKKWTRRVWMPLEWQMRAIKRFFASGRLADIAEEADEREQQLKQLLPERQLRFFRKQWKDGFPFFCETDNLMRHDDWDAMFEHNIYNDRWERTFPFGRPEEGPLDTFNYPELQGLTDAIMYAPIDGHQDSQAQVYKPEKSQYSSDTSVDETYDTGKGRIPLGHFDGKTFHYADEGMKERIQKEKDRVNALREDPDWDGQI